MNSLMGVATHIDAMPAEADGCLRIVGDAHRSRAATFGIKPRENNRIAGLCAIKNEVARIGDGHIGAGFDIQRRLIIAPHKSSPLGDISRCLVINGEIGSDI